VPIITANYAIARVVLSYDDSSILRPHEKDQHDHHAGLARSAPWTKERGPA
jgi:hypothetical protein